MKNKKLEANLYMAISKVFSGLNMNALKYLLPLWMSPLTGATIRCTFAAVAFWIIGWFAPPEEKTSRKDKWLLFLLGALGLYGFMFLYLIGLSKTTPVSSSIFTSLHNHSFLISITYCCSKIHIMDFSIIFLLEETNRTSELKSMLDILIFGSYHFYYQLI